MPHSLSVISVDLADLHISFGLFLYNSPFFYLRDRAFLLPSGAPALPSSGKFGKTTRNASLKLLASVISTPVSCAMCWACSSLMLGRICRERLVISNMAFAPPFYFSIAKISPLTMIASLKPPNHFTVRCSSTGWPFAHRRAARTAPANLRVTTS